MCLRIGVGQATAIRHLLAPIHSKPFKIGKTKIAPSMMDHSSKHSPQHALERRKRD
jgi:hypothetical protein